MRTNQGEFNESKELQNYQLWLSNCSSVTNFSNHLTRFCAERNIASSVWCPTQLQVPTTRSTRTERAQNFAFNRAVWGLMEIWNSIKKLVFGKQKCVCVCVCMWALHFHKIVFAQKMSQYIKTHLSNVIIFHRLHDILLQLVLEPSAITIWIKNNGKFSTTNIQTYKHGSTNFNIENGRNNKMLSPWKHHSYCSLSPRFIVKSESTQMRLGNSFTFQQENKIEERIKEIEFSKV